MLTSYDRRRRQTTADPISSPGTFGSGELKSKLFPGKTYTNAFMKVKTSVGVGRTRKQYTGQIAYGISYIPANDKLAPTFNAAPWFSEFIGPFLHYFSMLSMVTATC